MYTVSHVAKQARGAALLFIQTLGKPHLVMKNLHISFVFLFPLLSSSAVAQEAKLYHGGAKGPNGENSNSPPSPSAADDGGGGGAIVLGDGVVRRPIGVAGAAVRDGGMRGDDQLIRGESARDIIEGRKQVSAFESVFLPIFFFQARFCF